MATLVTNLVNNATVTSSILGSALSTTASLALIGGVMPSTKWRNKIIRDRLVRNAIKPKATPTLSDIIEPNLIPHTQIPMVSNAGRAYNSGIMTMSTIGNQVIRETQRKARDSFLMESIYTPLGLPHLKISEELNDGTKPLSLNPKRKKPNVKAWILNTMEEPYKYIEFQTKPSNIKVNPQTNWATIRSMGRNLPMYHYTGAEDTIEINISWYQDNKQHADDVLNKCRILESWSKANGYLSSPPLLQIVLGDGEGPFEGQYFILYSASYELTHFGVFQYKDQKRSSSKDPNIASEVKYYPVIARQSLVFKRVMDTNPTWDDIIPNEKVQHTSGVKTDNYQESQKQTAVLKNDYPSIVPTVTDIPNTPIT